MIKTLHTVQRRGRPIIVKIAIYFVLILIGYQFLYPILRMVVLSMMSARDVINPAVTWIPSGWTFNNLRIALQTLELERTLIGSLWFSTLLAVCQTIVSSLTGYALARYEFPGRRIWFVMVLMSFIIPAPVVVIPRIMMFVGIQEGIGLQLIGTWIPQTVLAILGQGVYSAILILICYNFFRMIPRALDEAASIDGANSFQVFVHVILRLSISTILVVFLFSFVWNWNETYFTGTFLRGSVPLLPNRLAMFDSMFATYGQGTGTVAAPENRINEAFKMSGTLIAILPLLIMYLFVQRNFIKGIENAGITGE